MATKKLIIEIDKDTYYDERSEKLKFSEVLTSTVCGRCGNVISIGESSWEKQTGGDKGWMSYHENCVKIIPIENAIRCVWNVLEMIGEV